MIIKNKRYVQGTRYEVQGTNRDSTQPAQQPQPKSKPLARAKAPSPRQSDKSLPDIAIVSTSSTASCKLRKKALETNETVGPAVSAITAN